MSVASRASHFERLFLFHWNWWQLLLFKFDKFRDTVRFLRNLLILNISVPASKMIGVKLNNREALYREVTSFLNMKENGELRWCNTPSIFKWGRQDTQEPWAPKPTFRLHNNLISSVEYPLRNSTDIFPFHQHYRELKQRRRRRQREQQKSNRLRLAKQQLCTCITLFCTFLCCRCTTTKWKCLILRVVEDVNTRRWLLFFLSWTSIQSF